MAHTVIFSKRVCHQTIYDNWNTATCMRYHSGDSTNNLAQIAQSLPYAFTAELTPLKY